jgi:hypothetical protein
MVASFIEPKTETGLVAPLERALLASPPPAVKPDHLLVPDILSLYQTNSFLTVLDLIRHERHAVDWFSLVITKMCMRVHLFQFQ